MKKALLIILLINCYLLINTEIYAQKRRNFLGYMIESSIFIPTIVGLSYERHIKNQYSISIQCNGIIQKNIQGFKIGIEPKYYFKNLKDTLTLCNNWYLGVKPMYIYYHEIGATYTNNLNPSAPITTVIPPINHFLLVYLITFGKQWVWKNGIFLNANIGIGLFQTFKYNPDNSIFQDRSPFVRDFITGDVALRLGYSF